MDNVSYESVFGRRLSFLTSSQQFGYERWFKSVVGNRFMMPGKRARAILNLMDLSDEILAHVWSLADETHSGGLMFPEFAVALYLCNLKFDGSEIPFALPEHIREEVVDTKSQINKAAGKVWDGRPECTENPKLCYLFTQTLGHDQCQQLLDAGLTDLWLPLPKKVLRRLAPRIEESNALWNEQDHFLDDDRSYHPFRGEHYSLFDSESIELEEMELLGAGGYGEVHRVRYPRTGLEYARKTMARPVVYKQHCDLLKNFRREVSGMRRVSHRHCVNLAASITSMDSVILLSSPVADMDLSKFLDLHTGDPGELMRQRLLRNAIGCITSALAYLHSLDIRHDDLKPNNILIHGSNILLTDFGFCLDFSDSGISTTAGPPAHFTQRYSAPEVFNREPRSRLTDIWGLGCVLFEIVSRLQGYTLHTLKIFWCSNGNKYDSFAQNQDSTKAWYHALIEGDEVYTIDRKDALLLSLVYHILLEPDRLHRPDASQVLERLKDMDLIYPRNLNGDWLAPWLAPCCVGMVKHSTQGILDLTIFKPHYPWNIALRNSPESPILDLKGLDCRLSYIILDFDWNIAGSGNIPSFLGSGVDSDWGKLQHLFLYDTILTIQAEMARVKSNPNFRSTTEVTEEQVDITCEDVLKGLYLSRIEDTHFKYVTLGFQGELPFDKRFCFAQIRLFRLCLKRQPCFGKPYLLITFNSDEVTDVPG